MGVSQEEGSRTDTLARRAQSSTLRKSSATTDSSGPGLGASLSAGSVKNVTIHPEVTQFSYNHHKPRYDTYTERVGGGRRHCGTLKKGFAPPGVVSAR